MGVFTPTYKIYRYRQEDEGTIHAFPVCVETRQSDTAAKVVIDIWSNIFPDDHIQIEYCQPVDFDHYPDRPTAQDRVELHE